MNLDDLEPTRRFSNRADDYVKYRPYYPQDILDFLRHEAGLTPDSVIADIGSGTGNLSVLFLKNGNRVYGIEPNDEMRAAGERQLAEFNRFLSVKGRAEATTLEETSVDFVTAGQSFHWFDRDAARQEFARILRPGGYVVLVWNDWGGDRTPLTAAYHQIVREHSIDYSRVRHNRASEDETISTFFGAGPGGGKHFTSRHFDNSQILDREALRGRALSSSYSPTAGHPLYEVLIGELDRLFDRHQENGVVRLLYDTVVYLGRLE